MRKAVDGFLFSIDLFFQSELEDYEPRGIIKVEADIKKDRRVNVYQRLTVDFCTDESRAALLKFGEFSLPSDITYTRKRGPVILENGVYTGEWNQQHEHHGFGKFQDRDGSIRIGQWKHSVNSGRARLIHADGSVYEGDFSLHKSNGFGKRFWCNGTTYTGEFLNAKMQGIGYLEEGDKSGLLWYSIGEFYDDKISGLGAQFGRDGPIYVGEFKAWKRHGKGILREAAQCFLGEFVEDSKQIHS